MRKLITMLALSLGALALSATAFAHDGRGDRDDHHGHHKGHHKHGHKHGHAIKRTFTVTTTDNGSCGTPWATDTVKRTFFVQKNRDGSYTLTRFDRGDFVTLAGKSPGACDTTGDHGQTIRAGVQGRLVGFIRGTVTGGTFDRNATCTGPQCGFTDVFLTTFFGPTAQFSCFTNSSDCKFNFNYVARDQGLLFHHWQDKGKGGGTMLNEEFNGDIADA
jgi:hypothetical protein